MVEKAFNEIKLEARTGEVTLQEQEYTRIFRVNFNIVDNDILNDIPNLYLNNKLNEEITLEIINLITQNAFLEEIVREKER